MKKIEKSQGIIISILVLLSIFYFSFLYHFLGEIGRILFSCSFPFYLMIYFFNFIVSNIINRFTLKFQTSGYYESKRKLFYFSHGLFFCLIFIFLLFMWYVSPLLIHRILKESIDRKLLSSIISTFRISIICTFIQPFLNICRGYSMAHHLEKKVFCSYLIDIFVGIVMSLFLPFLGKSIFHLQNQKAIFFVFVGLFFGNFVAFLYLAFVMNRSKNKFREKIRRVKEPIFSYSNIFKRIFSAFKPYFFIMIALFIYLFIDINAFFNYLENQEKAVLYSNYVTWTMLFNAFLVAITVFVLKKSISNMELLEDKKKTSFICRTLILLMLFLIPITLMISFLAKPIWFLLYDQDIYGYSILSYSIFGGLFFCFYLGILYFLKYLGVYKPIFISFLMGLLFKGLFIHRLMNVFSRFGISSYYGIITVNVLVFLLLFIYCLFVFYFKYKLTFEVIIKSIIDIVCSCIMMMILLSALKLLVPICSNNRIVNLILIIFYCLVGLISYFGGINFLKVRDKIRLLE